MTTSTCQLHHCDRPAPTGLCRTHRTELATALDNVQLDLQHLHDETIRDVRHTAGTSGSSTSTPIPWNDAASRRLDRLIRDLLTWSASAADHLGEPVRWLNAFQAVRYIHHATTLGRLDTWPQVGPLLGYLATTSKAVDELTANPPERVFAGYCDQTITHDDGTTKPCGTRLMADSDDDTVTCPRCATVHYADDGVARIISTQTDQLVTAAQAAIAIRLERGTTLSKDRLVDRIRRWSDRGLIVAKGTITEHGRPRDMYRLGDILDQLDRMDTTRRPGRRAHTTP